MNSIAIKLPDWFDEYEEGSTEYRTTEGKMTLAIEVARRNVDEDLGGPFGAAVFERDTGRLISVASNRVMDEECSVLHAEVLAIILAQRKRGSYTLAESGSPACELVTSCAPCCMCMGAIIWSGVKRLVCGAREVDAFEVGFDEGPKPDDWVAEFASRGIEVVQDVRRGRARELFSRYIESGGVVYNPE
ncbi:MAG: nucleoside deaminase [Planctomycetota bacterium]